jgi:hypothetical protein
MIQEMADGSWESEGKKETPRPKLVIPAAFFD